MKLIKLKVNYKDDRGNIVDMIENENINAVTLVTFKKGATRGNHFHKKTLQYNYVVKGEISVVTQTNNSPKKIKILKRGDLAAILPMEKHALKALKDAELLVFTKGPRGGKEYETDTFRLKVPLI